jgi:hypothetical protein
VGANKVFSFSQEQKQMHTRQTTNNASDSLDAVLNPKIALRAHAKHMTVMRSTPLDSTEYILTPDETEKALADAEVYLAKMNPQDQESLDAFARLIDVIKSQIRPTNIKLNT